eukprot:1160268-Pelagomonas_calceolata.AAC.9
MVPKGRRRRNDSKKGWSLAPVRLAYLGVTCLDFTESKLRLLVINKQVKPVMQRLPNTSGPARYNIGGPRTPGGAARS